MAAKYWNDLASEINIVSLLRSRLSGCHATLPLSGDQYPRDIVKPTGMKNDVNIMRCVERNKQYHLTRPSYDTEFGWSELVKLILRLNIV